MNSWGTKHRGGLVEQLRENYSLHLDCNSIYGENTQSARLLVFYFKGKCEKTLSSGYLLLASGVTFHRASGCWDGTSPGTAAELPPKQCGVTRSAIIVATVIVKPNFIHHTSFYHGSKHYIKPHVLGRFRAPLTSGACSPKYKSAYALHPLVPR